MTGFFNFRQEDGRISTRQRRPARWADSHVAAAPGKVGRFPRGSGARWVFAFT
uniref:Uncharacterized protein n=1 Tax=Citrobacter freundii TaxID=546 RepID=A0A3G2CCZ8_CITFR|nr:hypothetical protein [Citrobacter freundii]